MEDRETEEFVLVLERYYSQLVGVELPVEWKDRDPEPIERVPSYHSRHMVPDAPWSYCPNPDVSPDKEKATIRNIDLSIPPPPYILCEERRLSRSNSRDQFSIATSPSSVDHNMNEMQGLMSSSLTSLPLCLSPARSKPEEQAEKALADVAFSGPEEEQRPVEACISELQAQRIAADPPPPRNGGGIDLHSVLTLELLEEPAEDGADDSTAAAGRVSEMGRIVSDAQRYLDLGLKSNDSLLFVREGGSQENSATEEEEEEEEEANSFGLHSPFVDEAEDVEELLRQLQTSTSMLFEENALCLDPDIIDLTIIPPPNEDLDQETGQRREFYTPEPDQSDPPEEEEPPEDGIVFSAAHHEEAPPAPDDLSAYIIPPPPPSSSRAVEEQNRVLARFRKAAEEIRHMMAHGYASDSMHSVSKFCTIPRRSHAEGPPERPSIASLVTPIREKAALDEARDSETGVSWRPQPPPRVKRNSIAAAAAELQRETTSQSDPPTNGHSANCDPPPTSNGFHNGNGEAKQPLNGHRDAVDGDFYVNGEYNGYDSSEFQPPPPASCDACAGKNGLSVCCCPKKKSFLSYHHSLPRKGFVVGKLSVAADPLLRPKLTFATAQQEIADMIENLDLAVAARLQEVSEDGGDIPVPPDRLAKVRDALVGESRQFVTASKLFVRSIGESPDRREEHLAACVALLDRIFAVGELVVLEMGAPAQITCLAERLKETAAAYSRTVQAAHQAAGDIPNCGMAGLMHQATALATSLTVLMRTLRTFGGGP